MLSKKTKKERKGLSRQTGFCSSTVVDLWVHHPILLQTSFHFFFFVFVFHFPAKGDRSDPRGVSRAASRNGMMMMMIFPLATRLRVKIPNLTLPHCFDQLSLKRYRRSAISCLTN